MKVKFVVSCKAKDLRKCIEEAFKNLNKGGIEMSVPDCMYDYRQENISREPDVIGSCSYCSDEVTEGDCRYELDDDVILHEDCLTNYMHKYYKE